MLGSASSRYLLGLAAGIVLCFGAIWAYVLAVPEAFLESGYPTWEAKQSFISRCDLGETMISGTSRAEAAINPKQLNIATRNISFGAETPVEGYFFIRRAMACPKPPHEVLLTFAPPDFTWVSRFLWEDAMRFGFIHYDDVSDVAATARDLGDRSVASVQSRLGFGGSVRDFLYAVHFPPLYFNALLSGQVFRRRAANQAAYRSVRDDLGHVPYFRHGEAPPLAGPNVISGDFRPLPVQTAFFDRTLTLLATHGVQAIYIPMVVSESVLRRTSAASVRQFEAYLLGFARHHPNFHVVTPLTVAWPDEAFVDGIHIEASYASRFTERLKACQAAVRGQAGAIFTCDFSWKSASGTVRADQAAGP
jgi:hypothetical protein